MTLTDEAAALPDPSRQVSLNAYVRPPTAFTAPAFGPVTLASGVAAPSNVMLVSVQTGVAPESSDAVAEVATGTT